MAKLQSFSLLASLCCLSAIAIATASKTPDQFLIQGKVYCDNCRLGFVTRASRYIQGAKVMIQCQNWTSTEKTFSAVGVTDKSGMYSVGVPDHHFDEDCTVTLMSSPNIDCKERKAGAEADAVSILLTDDNVSEKIRHANPLGFLRAKPLQICSQVLLELSGDY